MTPDKIKRITCEHLLGLHKGEDPEHVVLDIRDHNEYETGHIINSVHVPRAELETNIHNLIPKKGQRVIVVVGATQQADIEAVHDELAALGYKQIEFLSGGFDRWCEIAPLELEPELIERTPEEMGFTGEGLSDIDPEGEEGEPLM